MVAKPFLKEWLEQVNHIPRWESFCPLPDFLPNIRYHPAILRNDLIRSAIKLNTTSALAGLVQFDPTHNSNAGHISMACFNPNSI